MVWLVFFAKWRKDSILRLDQIPLSGKVYYLGDMEFDPSALLQQLIPVSPEQARFVREKMPVLTYPKGTELITEGSPSRTGYWLFKGLIRKYKMLDGVEKTLGFYTEGSNVVDLKSYNNGLPAFANYVCQEECIVAAMNYKDELELYAAYPEFERLCRMSIEEDYAHQQEEQSTYITSTPEQRYLRLLEERPDLLQRVPQYQIASYLGIEPESLSRIRKRMVSK